MEYALIGDSESHHAFLVRATGLEVIQDYVDSSGKYEILDRMDWVFLMTMPKGGMIFILAGEKGGNNE